MGVMSLLWLLPFALMMAAANHAHDHGLVLVLGLHFLQFLQFVLYALLHVGQREEHVGQVLAREVELHLRQAGQLVLVRLLENVVRQYIDVV